MYMCQTALQEKSISLESIYSLFEATYDSDYSFSGETHNFWEIVYVLSGEICVSADGRIYRLTDGNIIFHKPMELHKFHIENNKKATLFIMSFTASGPLMKTFENYVLELSREQKQVFTNMISFLRSECHLTPEYNLMVLEEIQKNPTQFQIFICMAELFFLSLSKDNISVPTTVDTPDALVFRTAVKTMERRIHEWIAVPEIARECNVSVPYLKKIFTKYAGLGVHQYFLKQKISFASHMLIEGKSVTETADALSFNSASYFCTVYKRETGITPSAYKRSDEKKTKNSNY